MDLLIDGYRRFRQGGWPHHAANFRAMARDGQAPSAMVVACADSRVDPQLIFDAAPGELFSIRNVANLVPPYQPDAAYHGTSAALEFGIVGLGVRNLVVLGHGECGGVRALLEGPPPGLRDFVGTWMGLAEDAREHACRAAPPGPQRQREGEFAVVRTSLANLMTFPWIRERVEDGRLTLHGMWFSVFDGSLWRMAGDDQFAAVSS